MNNKIPTSPNIPTTHAYLQPQSKPIYTSTKRIIQQTSRTRISLRFISDPIDSEHIYAIDTLCYILGIGHESILYHTLVHKNKDCFNISIHHFSTKQGNSYIDIKADCEPKKEAIRENNVYLNQNKKITFVGVD